MEQEPTKVVTLDSDSEPELEILSESIPNYGNYSTPVEIAPELQEKIKISLEKRGNLPGKIKTIKVYATKRSSQLMGSVRASFRPPGGHPTKTINVGASINDVFTNQVRGGGNNNSKKPELATASESVKRPQQPLPVVADQKVTERPSAPSSPVILYSPIRKGKTAKLEDILVRALPTPGFQQTETHTPENLCPSTPSLVPWEQTISQCLDGENVSRESSKSEIKVKTNIPKDKYDLDLNTSDKVFKNVCAKVIPVELSPIRFSSDDDEEESAKDSILGIWNSPVPSSQNYVNPFLEVEQNSAFGEVISKDYVDVSKDSKDLVVSEETLQNMPMDLIKEIWAKMNEDDKNSKQQYLYEKENIMNEEEESNLENLVDQDGQHFNGERETVLYNETNKITDVYNEEYCSNFGLEKQNSSDKFAMSKYIKINVESFPKRSLGSSVSSDKDVSNAPLWIIKDGSDPPLWSTIFPPSPPSPPPENWTRSSELWELDVGGFEAITGLCGHQTANDFKRKLNEPKPLVRVLRKRHKN